MRVAGLTPGVWICLRHPQELYDDDDAGQWKANCEGCLRAKRNDIVNSGGAGAHGHA